MTRVVQASTLAGATALAAALDDRLFGEDAQRCVLIVTNVAPVPEVTLPLHRRTGFAAISDRFDDVVHWNDVIAPLHPADWMPRGVEAPMLQRLIRRELGLDGDVTRLVLESPDVAPARAIGTLLRDCPVSVLEAGLRCYGPTSDELPVTIGSRVEHLLHHDLVPGLPPLLLRELEVPAVAVPADTVRRASEFGTGDHGDGAGLPLLVGDGLAVQDILTPAEEQQLHLRALTALAAAGHRPVAFRPHDLDHERRADELRRAAARAGVELLLVDAPVAQWFGRARPVLVVGGLSPALFTAQRHHGLAVATVGTELLLERLAPYEHPLRVPATIADAALPRLRDDGTVQAPAPADLPALVESVSYCAHATRLPASRAVAEAYLAEHGSRRYFKKRRLEALDLVPEVSARVRTAEHETPAEQSRRLVRAAGRRVVAARKAAAKRVADGRRSGAGAPPM